MIPLAQRPQTWVFVDDEERFLESLQLILPKDQPARFFSRPSEALEYFRKLEVDQPTVSLPDEAELDLADVADLILNPQRFAQPSVLIVDYAMPEMNGLQMIDKLGARSVKTILLTGVADEKVASQAFNAGKIDRYIRKGDREALALIQRHANELNQEFVQRLVNVKIDKALGENVDSPAFRSYFQSKLVNLRVKEFYYLGHPSGYLCISESGRVFFVGVFTLSMLQNLGLSHDVDRGEPIDVRALVAVMFGYGPDDLADDEFSLQQLGPSDLWVGILADPPLEVDYQPDSNSLRAYLSESRS